MFFARAGVSCIVMFSHERVEFVHDSIWCVLCVCVMFCIFIEGFVNGSPVPSRACNERKARFFV